MPYSFTQIQEDKSKTIGFVFFFLIIFYFLSFLLIAVVVNNVLQFQNADYEERLAFHFTFLSGPALMAVFFLASAIGAGHWYYTVDNLLPKMTGVLGAEALNAKDAYHQTFQNILDEVSIATGNKKKITGVVIPTATMNAFALQDFNRKNIIGVTEGLLARLNRPQLEAVVGHEAAHIISGDCLGTTVTTSIFALYGGMLHGIERLLRGEDRYRYSNRGNGSFFILIMVVYVLLLATRLVSNLARMFISRERELRADAISVQLTRDPLSLAGALYSIARYRGGGLGGDELDAIFIVNPQFSTLDEDTGIFSDLFSTHPPVEKRLKILLDMAHSDLKTLEQDVENQNKKPRQDVPTVSVKDINQTQWMVNKNGNWQGPFGLSQLTGLNWISSDVWIKRVGDDQAKMAQDDEEFKSIFNQTKNSENLSCPQCQVALITNHYEGVEVYQCPLCRGTLIKDNDIKRVIIREDVGFSERIVKMAQTFKDDITQGRIAAVNRDPKTLLPCPQCFNVNKTKMNRLFYTEAYPIEVDRCYFCGIYWFQKDELEVLQCLIEDQVDQNPS